MKRRIQIYGTTLVGFTALASMMLAFAWAFSGSSQAKIEPPVVQRRPAPKVEAEPTPTPVVEPEEPTPPATAYETVEAYFTAGNPNPLSHRFGLSRYNRDVSESTKKKVKARDGNCCLVCGSTYKLEVDHRRALMNNGDNSEDNLATLCDSCHNKKTRLDWSIKKRRRKNGESH